MNDSAFKAIRGDDFRDCMGRFTTGVAIVTTRGAAGERVGVTINSFTSLSLEPPLVLFNLDRSARSLAAFEDSETFAVNLLSEKQAVLSTLFAQRDVDKWTGVDAHRGRTGCPLLAGAMACIECRKTASYDGGDHVIFIGEVVALSIEQEAEPLVYYRGRYGRFASSG